LYFQILAGWSSSPGHRFVAASTADGSHSGGGVSCFNPLSTVLVFVC